VIFANPSFQLAIPVLGLIGNSVPTSKTGKDQLVEWKKRVTVAVRQYRGSILWQPDWRYSISVGFSFHQAKLKSV
jgi:hypothetical protein